MNQSVSLSLVPAVQCRNQTFEEVEFACTKQYFRGKNLIGAASLMTRGDIAVRMVSCRCGCLMLVDLIKSQKLLSWVL